MLFQKNMGHTLAMQDSQWKTYNLSDEQVINEINVNLAFREFIGIEPDEDVPCASLLSIFRTTKLDDVSLDYIISEIVRQCIEKNIIKADDGISMDTTHIEANTIKKVPERVMKHLAKKICCLKILKRNTFLQNMTLYFLSL